MAMKDGLLNSEARMAYSDGGKTTACTLPLLKKDLCDSRRLSLPSFHVKRNHSAAFKPDLQFYPSQHQFVTQSHTYIYIYKLKAWDNAKGQSGGFGSLEALLLQKNRHLEHELTMARLKVRVESLEALLLQKNRHLARELTMARLKARQAVSSQHTQQTQRQPASRSACMSPHCCGSMASLEHAISDLQNTSLVNHSNSLVPGPITSLVQSMPLVLSLVRVHQPDHQSCPEHAPSLVPGQSAPA
eukprot:1160648-Pelagomonas_calceolata.AAC.7